MSIIYLGMLNFNLIFFSCSRSHWGYQFAFSCRVCLCSWHEQFFRLSMSLMTQRVLRSTGWCFVECSLLGVFLMLFSWQGLRYALLGEDLRDKMPFSSYYIKSTQYQYNVAAILGLCHLAEIVFITSLHSKCALLHTHSRRHPLEES